jgi:prepilin peptidase CpaA
LLDLLDIWILIVTTLSVFFDIFVRRIPNWLVLFGLTGGLLLNGLHGFSQLYNSVLGFVLGIAIFIIPFAMGWVGAGDVKYLGVVGSILGFHWLPRVLFYSSLAGGLLAIVFLAYNRIAIGGVSFLSSAWLDCKIAVLSLGRVVPEGINARMAKGSHGVPWGVAIGVGTILAYYIDPQGKWAGF